MNILLDDCKCCWSNENALYLGRTAALCLFLPLGNLDICRKIQGDKV